MCLGWCVWFQGHHSLRSSPMVGGRLCGPVWGCPPRRAFLLLVLPPAACRGGLNPVEHSSGLAGPAARVIIPEASLCVCEDGSWKFSQGAGSASKLSLKVISIVYSRNVSYGVLFSGGQEGVLFLSPFPKTGPHPARERGLHQVCFELNLHQ